MNGDQNGPGLPLVCPHNPTGTSWLWSSCTAADHCGGLHCNAAQTCHRQTDASGTSFQCRVSTALIIGVSVGGAVLCGLLLACLIGWRRRRAQAQEGFLTSQPYLSESHTAAHYETAYQQHD